MKFLLFNLVVIGALAFLFVKKEDVRDLVPDRIAAPVEDALRPDRGRERSAAVPVTDEPVVAVSVERPRSTPPEEQQQKTVVAEPGPAPKASAVEGPVITPPPQEPELTAPRLAQVPAATAERQPPLPLAAPSVPVQSSALPEPTGTAQPSAEAAARRALITGPVPEAEAGTASVLTALERQARLRSLSEEMEFFAVDAMAQ